ncbi:unnamed protein product [Amaranthus hypochondriacus]
MDSSFQGAVLDPVKCSKLSMEERREIVYELAKWSHGAPEMLQTWSRQDILQILCSEMGKERKYTGLTKLKIIEHLLKVVSEKISVNHEMIVESSSPSIDHKGPKNPRKPDNPSHLYASVTNISICSREIESDTAIYCKNSACKARLSMEDKFCKRCTCCICLKYDDNKDPSLWLTCSSEPPFFGDSCNLSCHLECAIKHERSGIARNGTVAQLDGSFYCISCGKMNDLMSCWRKQLLIAKDTRRVDILCYRIFISKKLLAGTKKYQKPSDAVDDAIKLLEEEVGTLTGVPVKNGRGIVNRLSSGQEVQRLCTYAVDLFESMHHQTPLHPASRTMAPSIIEVEPVNATSTTNICSDVMNYSTLERIQSPATNCSTLSNPSSVEDETNNIAPCSELNVNKPDICFNDPTHCASDEENATGKFVSSDQSDATKADLKQSLDGQSGDGMSTDNESNDQPEKSNTPCVGIETSLPITPSKQESSKDGTTKKSPTKSHRKAQNDGMEEVNCRRSLKKRILEKEIEECDGDCPSDRDLEYYVKVIRRLEHEGYIEKSFRQMFLTWYSIRATPQESRIVKVFVETFIDDPASLSEQLQDTFEEIISSKRFSVVPPGFCLKLWH